MQPTDEPIRVLHVDDEPDFTDAVSTFIEQQTDGFTVEISRSASDALNRLTSESFDCVVSDFDMPDQNGIEFLQAVREIDPDLPFILFTGKGSEEIASDAISAGVTDYLQKESGKTQFTVLANRIQNAVAKYHAEAELAEREKRLNLFFEQSPLGVIEWDQNFEAVRLNDSASDILGYTEQDLVGHGWQEIVPESEAGAIEDIVSDLLENRGGFHSVNENIRKNGDRIVCEWHNRVVTDEDDDVVAVFSQFQDITERKAHERELEVMKRRLEAILQNTTTPMFMKDDSGEYIFVNQGYRDLFDLQDEEVVGRTDSEIHPPEVATTVKKNDQAVIEGGEPLETEQRFRFDDTDYVFLTTRVPIYDTGKRSDPSDPVAVFCVATDITDRKRTEQNFNTLYETAHDLLSATNEEEIADIIVDATCELLDLPYTVLFRFESTENAFVPVAYSAALERAAGTPPTIPADEQSLTGEAFFEEQLRTMDDIHTAETVYEPEFPVRKAVFVPLGEHGVLVAGAPDTGEFDTQTASVAELLGTTVRSAFARLTREQVLEERQWELEQQTQQLEKINNINELIRGINEELIEVKSTSEIEQVVCDNLVARDQYGFAWIGKYNPTSETVEPRTWAGSDRGYLDTIRSGETVDNELPYPAKQTAQSGELSVVTNIADGLRNDQWRREALSRGFQSALSLPLEHEDIPYGIVTVYATSTEAFDPLTRTVFEELGGMIANTIHSVETREGLTADTVIELELAFDDVDETLTTIADRAECTLTVEAVLPQDDCYLTFFSAPASGAETVKTVVRDLPSVRDFQVITTDDDRVTFEASISDPPIAHTLVEHGAIPQKITIDGETTNAIIEVPTTTDIRDFIEQLQTKYPDIELVARHRRDRPVETRESLESNRTAGLTERQLEVLEVAYHSGYFKSPRQRTGAEVAESLDITQPTFTYHLRRALENLVESVLVSTTASSSLDE